MAYFGIGGPGGNWMPPGSGSKIGYGGLFGGMGGMGGMGYPGQSVMPQTSGGGDTWGAPSSGPYQGMWGGKYMPLLQLVTAAAGGFMDAGSRNKQREWERETYEQKRRDEEERRRRMTQAWNSAISSMGG